MASSSVRAAAVLALLIGSLGVTACGESADQKQTSQSSTNGSIDGLATDMSVPPPSVPPIPRSEIPPEIECPVDEISRDTGESFEKDDTFGTVLTCVDGWAVGVPQRFVAEWDGDTDVEGEWVFTRHESKWKVFGVCHVYYPIDSFGRTCDSVYDNQSIDPRLAPPYRVQCTLWSASSWSDNVATTGCPVSPNS